MTKTQLVQTIADGCEITKKAARNLLDTLAHTAVTEVKKSGAFVIPGIGRLIRIDRKLDLPVDAPPDGSRIRVSEIEVPPPKSAPKGPKNPKGPRTGAKTDWLVNDASSTKYSAIAFFKESMPPIGNRLVHFLQASSIVRTWATYQDVGDSRHRSGDVFVWRSNKADPRLASVRSLLSFPISASCSSVLIETILAHKCFGLSRTCQA